MNDTLKDEVPIDYIELLEVRKIKSWTKELPPLDENEAAMPSLDVCQLSLLKRRYTRAHGMYARSHESRINPSLISFGQNILSQTRWDSQVSIHARPEGKDLTEDTEGEGSGCTEFIPHSISFAYSVT
ncbi:hypothetical protein IEO21_07280 [Rhodonia placenta]|uniref:Uncharacterized protein n=1 Tax=Rhodonia placenta TaxID=104341 RepID=A0A8H7TZY1_9APHY|nr:hypothetical protein IEO21_07280 [Postia placenta]